MKKMGNTSRRNLGKSLSLLSPLTALPSGLRTTGPWKSG